MAGVRFPVEELVVGPDYKMESIISPVSLIVKTPVIINDRYTYRIGNVGTMPYTGNPVVGPDLKMESKF